VHAAVQSVGHAASSAPSHCSPASSLPSPHVPAGVGTGVAGSVAVATGVDVAAAVPVDGGDGATVLVAVGVALRRAPRLLVEPTIYRNSLQQREQ